MNEPPLLLKLLAQRTKKALQREPLVKTATIRRLRLAPPLLTIDALAFEGSGLANLKIDTLAHNLDTDAIKVAGSYYGIGFEADGSAAAPQIYLKENIVTKTLGQESDRHGGD
jgi:hypothetical protein